MSRAYAFMKAMDLVNDHAATCVVAKQVTQARKAFRKSKYERSVAPSSSRRHIDTATQVSTESWQLHTAPPPDGLKRHGTS